MCHIHICISNCLWSTYHRLEDESHELDDLKLRNDPSESQAENLISLPYLHEPAILYCLEQRYNHSDIYTYTGPILIAMNPFKNVQLYTSQILEKYYNEGLMKSQGIETNAILAPHVYAIADAAYRDMMNTVKQQGKSSANQSILVSGESGAGKTESTKIVLRYLTTVGNAAGGIQVAEGSVMDKIMQSNPILEAFGNARTLRNDNSSRFGKFIELNFNKRGHLIGGKIKTYLLEKVRLPCQQNGERNFHIFYQLAAGATEEERRLWELKPLQNFWYTNQGDIFELRYVNDSDEYHAMRMALNTLNFSVEDQTALLNTMAGLMHIGELEFTKDADGEGSELVAEDGVQASLAAAARLCGISVDSLVHALTVKVIVTTMETLEKKLTPTQALDTRDAISKAIYGRLFDW